jgi:hypothetical protein
MSFSRKFANDAISAATYHRSIYFTPSEGTTNEQIIKKIQEVGIASFCQPDYWNVDGYAVFNDNRFPIGQFKIIQNASCCAFTRNAGYFYLFPIHREELWIKKFNDQKVGFEYLYFGEQAAPACTNVGEPHQWFSNYPSTHRNNIFYWVGVPVFDQVNILKPYLHWVALRYLWNGLVSGTNRTVVLPNAPRLAYYNIPRVTMMLHEDYKMSFLKAFLYAHAAHPWNYGNSMCFSDYMGVSGNNRDIGDYNFKASGLTGPCLNITKARFRALWEAYGKKYNVKLNEMLTQNAMKYLGGADLKGLTSLKQAYDGHKVLELFSKGDYAGFIKEIKDSYKIKKEAKKNEKKLVLNPTIGA